MLVRVGSCWFWHDDSRCLQVGGCVCVLSPIVIGEREHTHIHTCERRYDRWCFRCFRFVKEVLCGAVQGWSVFAVRESAGGVSVCAFGRVACGA
jgi:hypothetical protein